MSTTTSYRDERTIAVENASYRMTYLFLAFGILVIVAYRGFALHEQSWDLLALVVLSGVLGALYQGYQRVLTREWVVTCFLAVAGAALVAGLVVWLR